MRALKVCALVSVFACAPVTGWGATQTLSTQAIGQSIQGSADPASSLGQPQVSQFRQVLGYQIEGLGGGFTLSSSMTTIQPNYSSYFVTEKGGAQVPLSQLVGSSTELGASAGVSWASGPHQASLNWSGSVSSSPFELQSLTASMSEAFFQKTTLVGLRAGAYTARQPTSYYIGVDYVTRARPGLIHGNELEASCDQVLSERFKLGVELSTADRQEDRPRNLGGTLSGVYALSDRFFGRMALSRLGELRSQPLLDERGYFTLSAAEWSVTYEPWIDWLITPSYAWVLEEESDPRTGRTVRVGSDQYGLGMRYRRGVWELELNTQYRLTNTALSDLVLGGGIKWRI